MINLGIYGDSFASTAQGHDRHPELSKKAWFNLFPDDYHVKSHGIAGSSLYHSYKLFLTSNKQFDRIIFVVTNYGRWPVPLKHNDNQIYIPSLTSTEFWIKELRLSRARDIQKKLLALRSYWTDLYDDLHEFNKDIHSLMTERIKQIRPDTIFVTFDDMMEYVDQFHKSLSLSSDEKFGNKFGAFNEVRCICHLSAEMNQHVYNDAVTALRFGSWTVTKSPQILHRSADYYYQ